MFSKKIKILKVAYDNNDKKMESVYSQRIRAGKRRTYFFDVRETRGNDYYLAITESRKSMSSSGASGTSGTSPDTGSSVRPT